MLRSIIILLLFFSFSNISFGEQKTLTSEELGKTFEKLKFKKALQKNYKRTQEDKFKDFLKKFRPFLIFIFIMIVFSISRSLKNESKKEEEEIDDSSDSTIQKSIERFKKKKEGEEILNEIDNPKSLKVKVEKEKIVRNNVSGEKSRASIPLFKMIKEKSYGYRNADYWQNSSDPINSIETEEVKGSVDGKLIYIPIKNYKTDFDGAKHNYALEQIRAMAQSVRSEAKDKSEEKEFVLFGVRYGDVKKLDDEVWVSFIDFYLDFCKSVIMREKPQGLLAYKKSCLQSSDLGLHEYQYDIGKLLSNPTFDTSSLSKDHIMVQAIEDWKLYDGGDLNRQIINSVNYVKLNDKDWLKNTFGEFEPKQVEKDFESLCLNYPLLRVIAMECPYYVELSATKAKITNKMILDYLSLCDMKGGGDS